jgi:hypothetical protein
MTPTGTNTEIAWGIVDSGNRMTRQILEAASSLHGQSWDVSDDEATEMNNGEFQQ